MNQTKDSRRSRSRARSRSRRRRNRSRSRSRINQDEGNLLSSFKQKFDKFFGAFIWELSRFYVARAAPCFLAIFLLAAAATVVVVPFFDLSRPDGGLRIRNDIIAEESDALVGLQKELGRLQEQFLLAGQGEEKVKADQGSGGGGLLLPPQTIARWQLEIIYQANKDEDDVFQPQNLEYIRRIEREILSHPEYKLFCTKSVSSGACEQHRSVSTWFFSDDNLLNADEAPLLTPSQINNTLTEMRLRKNRQATNFFFTNASAVPSLTRTRFSFGLPLKGYQGPNDRYQEQFDQFQQFAIQFHPLLNEPELRPELYSDLLNAAPPVKILFLGDGIYIWEALNTMANDFLLCVGSIVAVFVLLVLRMKSCFLGLAALFQVLLSFPIAFFFYRILLDLKLFGALNVLGIFIILGIGADDIFVMYDAFAQSKFDHANNTSNGNELNDENGDNNNNRTSNTDLTEVMYRTLVRAGRTMLVTSIMSFIAFSSVAVSPVPALSYFGWFTAILVVMNLALVFSFFACALVLHAKYFANWKLLPCIGSKKSKKTEREGDWLQLFCSGVFFRVLKKCYLLFLAIGILLVIVFSVVASGLKPADSAFSFWPEWHRWEKFIDAQEEFGLSVDSENNKVTMSLVFGVEGINRTGTDPSDMDDFGVTIMKNDFDPSSPSNQLALAALCADLRVHADELFIDRRVETNEPEIACVADELASWRRARFESFPIPSEMYTEVMLEFLGRAAFGQRLRNTVGIVGDRVLAILINANSTARVYDNQRIRRVHWNAWQQWVNNWFQQPHDFLHRQLADSIANTMIIPHGFTAPVITSGNSSLLSSATSLPAAADPKNGNKWLEMQQWNIIPVEKKEKPIITTGWYFVWMITQESFYYNAFLSIAVSSAVAAALVFVATFSWLLALLMLLLIGCVVALVIGLLVYPLNLTLGSFESVNMAILVGLAADFPLHFLFAYAEADRGRGGKRNGKRNENENENRRINRSARLQYALSTIGPSLSTASLSTLIATAPLFFTTVVFFVQFGKFFFITIAASILFTLIFLPSLILCIDRFFGDKEQLKISNQKSFELGVRTKEKEAKENENYSSSLQTKTSTISNNTISSSLSSSSLSSRRSDIIAFVCWLIFVLALVLGTLNIYIFSSSSAQTSSLPTFNTTSTTTSIPFVLPSGYKAKSVGGWWELFPEKSKNTSCARGSAYSFFYRPRSPKMSNDDAETNVVIEFEGGGACWNQRTCAVQSSTFKENALGTRQFFSSGLGDRGIRSVFDDRFHYLYITYCTADLHLGRKKGQKYDQFTTLDHVGFFNAAASLEFLYAQWPASSPSRILVTGCSAGSYASFFHSLNIARQFPSSKIFQLGDAGVGAISDSFLRDSFGRWNVDFPSWLFNGSSLDQMLDREPNFNVSSVYLAAARHALASNSGNYFAQWTSAYDWNQAFFYNVMLEQDDVERDEVVGPVARRRWAAVMRRVLSPLQHPRIRLLIHPGDDHCFIPYRRLEKIGESQTQWTDGGYSFINNGTSSDMGAIARQWLVQYFLSDSKPSSLECNGEFGCQLNSDQREFE